MPSTALPDVLASVGAVSGSGVEAEPERVGDTQSRKTKHGKRARLPALDGVRGIAALSVVLGHASTFGFMGGVYPGMRDYGVLLFFSLSGFLMSYLYRVETPDIQNVASYAAARIVRIVPVYYAVVLASWLVYTFLDHHFVYAVTTAQLVKLLTFNGSVSIFWSIGPEFQFYAVFIFLWWLWHRPSGRVATSVIAALLCIITWVTAGHISGVLFLSKSPVFLGGIVAAVAYDFLIRRRISILAIAAMQVISLAFLVLLAHPIAPLTGLLYPAWDNSDPTFSVFYCNPLRPAAAAFVVLSFAFSTRLSRLIFANPVTRFLGEVSFSLYLLHDIVLHAFSSWGGRVLGHGWIESLGAVLLSVAVAFVSYRLIEVTLRVRLRRPVTRILTGLLHKTEHAAPWGR